jgi:hypothetical protein
MKSDTTGWLWLLLFLVAFIPLGWVMTALVSAHPIPLLCAEIILAGGCYLGHRATFKLLDGTTTPAATLDREKASAAAVSMFTPKQKLIAYTGLGLLGLLAIFVPWTNYHHHPVGYGFIFYAPREAVKIDLVRAGIPMAFVVCATIAAVVLTAEKTRKDNSPHDPPDAQASSSK